MLVYNCGIRGTKHFVVLLNFSFISFYLLSFLCIEIVLLKEKVPLGINGALLPSIHSPIIKK